MTDLEKIEKGKTEIYAILAELDDDIEILRKNVAKARSDLEKVQTMGDAEKFDECHDLEKGLKHIQLL